MIIIKISGGLGNQMFQYALYKKVEKLSNNVKIYFNKETVRKDKNEYPEINRVFGIKYGVASLSDCSKLGDVKDTFFSKIRRRLLGNSKKKTHYIEENYGFENNYKPFIFKLTKGYLDGYWQSELYFKDIRMELLEIYKFPPIVGFDNKMFLEEICNTNSVGVHIRRGDYLTCYGYLICSLDYYRRAMEYMKAKCGCCIFFVFSDDINWVKENFVGDDIRIVSNNKGDNNYIDMQLMSMCKHNIIANSSFSWWGAWLNTNKEKIVISPKVWNEIHENKNIWCSNWIKM